VLKGILSAIGRIYFSLEVQKVIDTVFGVSENASIVLKPMNCVLLFLLASLASLVDDPHDHCFQVPAEDVPLDVAGFIRVPSIFTKITSIFYLHAEVLLLVLEAYGHKRGQRIYLCIYQVPVHLVVYI
jgi:hypothetical protein